MKERPILFSTPMVQAILDGRKTMTRRIVKLERFAPSTTAGYLWHFIKKGCWWDVNDIVKYCPYGQPGDRLWVRETWRPKRHNFPTGHPCEYKATAELDGVPLYEPWKPSIHMPRSAARIFLEIKSIRVERLEDITEEDAIREGCKSRSEAGQHPIWQFFSLWQSINGTGSWEANPWVWVVEFEMVEP